MLIRSMLIMIDMGSTWEGQSDEPVGGCGDAVSRLIGASAAAELLGVDRSTVRRHRDRGLAKLRAALEVDADA